MRDFPDGGGIVHGECEASIFRADFAPSVVGHDFRFILARLGLAGRIRAPRRGSTP